LALNVPAKLPMRLKRSTSGAAIAPFCYPIELPIRYQGEARGSIQGSGKTVQISSGSVRFAGDQDLRVGWNVRLAISWPVALADGTTLSLSIIGRIEEAARHEFRAAIIRHEFRTRGGKSSLIEAGGLAFE
jgi:hypothetical protein